MNGSTPSHLLHYVTRRLRLRRYLQDPGDGRRQPQIPAQVLLWAVLIGQILRQASFHAVEALARSSARRSLSIATPFCDDTLGYFTERLDPGPTRQALLSLVRGAKRNKAFDDCRWIGLALDGTGAGWRTQQGCRFCRPRQNAEKQILGYEHSLVMVSVVGTGLSLPCDGEPYGPGDSEYAAGQRLLRRVIGSVGKRFAQYVVVDGEFATAPFLHTVGELGLRVVARLKDNLPELFATAQQRFPAGPPTTVFQYGTDHVEVWDAEDFDPWETLDWKTVRVFFYRQYKPDGTVVQAYWLTNFPCSTVGAQALFRMAKSRWEIENQGFNEAKSHHGLEHISHHHSNSLLIGWLLIMLALTIERLYRLRYLHRGKHRVPTGAQMLLHLWLSLSRPCAANSS
jgi:predicted small metal-binding protein